MFVIVRHGNTFESGEPPRRIGARTDLPLTATGKEQSRALGLHFKKRGIEFERAFTSPLIRAVQTAEAILDEQVRPPVAQIGEFLREIDHGPDEGQPEPLVRDRIGEDALHAWESRAVPPDGWIVDEKARLASWHALYAETPSKFGPTLLVTSNGAARFALMSDPRLAEAAEALGSLKLPTGGFGIIARNNSSDWHLMEWGARP